MANEEHLAILKKGVTAWNQWRKENPAIEPNLRGADLRRVDLKGDAVMEAGEAWAADIRRTRHVGDFCEWKEHDKYKEAFQRLMRDLKAESKNI